MLLSRTPRSENTLNMGPVKRSIHRANSDSVKYGIIQENSHLLSVCISAAWQTSSPSWRVNETQTPVCVSDNVMATITSITPSLAHGKTSFTPSLIGNAEQSGEDFGVLGFSGFSCLDRRRPRGLRPPGNRLPTTTTLPMTCVLARGCEIDWPWGSLN